MLDKSSNFRVLLYFVIYQNDKYYLNAEDGGNIYSWLQRKHNQQIYLNFALYFAQNSLPCLGFVARIHALLT